MDISNENYKRSFSNYDIMLFNNLSRRIIYNDTSLIFTGDTLAVVYDGNYYNFRLDQWTQEYKLIYILGKI